MSGLSAKGSLLSGVQHGSDWGRDQSPERYGRLSCGVFAASPGGIPSSCTEVAVQGALPLWGGWGCREAQTPHCTPRPAPQSLGRNRHHQTPVGAGGVDVPVGPGVWDAVMAPGRAGGDRPLSSETQGVQDRQRPSAHTPGGLSPYLDVSKWAGLFSENLQPWFCLGEAQHRPPLPTLPCPNPALHPVLAAPWR